MSQITSEEIIQNAYENRVAPLRKVKQSIQDVEELRGYQQVKRKEYEQQLNKNRLNYGQWHRYAQWEAYDNHDFARARSIYERALGVDVQHVPFWFQYTQMELKNKNINHARNLLERAVTILPRVEKLWTLYVQTEEMLKEYQHCREVFDRWMVWRPSQAAWTAYIEYELRYDEIDNARHVFARFLRQYPLGEIWLKWIELELQIDSEHVREVFEMAVDTLISKSRNDPQLPGIIKKWSEWEVSEKEYGRARAMYKLILDKFADIFDGEQMKRMYESYVNFEKLYGDSESLEEGVLSKRQKNYEVHLSHEPRDYDTWWLLINLNDSKQTFEQAVAHPPEAKEKSSDWRKYILIWIRYALREEFSGDIESARMVWNRCLKVIPRSFTFGKVWRSFAEFEIRNSDISTARKILGRGIGTMKTPKKSIFEYYIQLERKLGEANRVRKIYEKWLEMTIFSPESVIIAYAHFEDSVGDGERAVAIFELGLELAEAIPFDNAERIWMSYITYFKDKMNYEPARETYRRLITKTDSIKVWVSFAIFESSILSEQQLEQFRESDETDLDFSVDESQVNKSREIFKEANQHFRADEEKRALILGAWLDYEKNYGTKESIDEVSQKLPQVTQKTRLVGDVEEEYLEYIFPEDKVSLGSILANARKWAQSEPKAEPSE